MLSCCIFSVVSVREPKLVILILAFAFFFVEGFLETPFAILAALDDLRCLLLVVEGVPV